MTERRRVTSPVLSSVSVYSPAQRKGRTMKKRFTEAQIVGFLREATRAAGEGPVPQARFSEASYYALAEQVPRLERVGRQAAGGIRDRRTR
jgi:hypothetical protein